MRGNHILLECGWLGIGVFVFMGTIVYGCSYSIFIPIVNRNVIIRIAPFQSILHLIIKVFFILIIIIIRVTSTALI